MTLLLDVLLEHSVGSCQDIAFLCELRQGSGLISALKGVQWRRYEGVLAELIMGLQQRFEDAPGGCFGVGSK